jgi:hypothetical protein
MRVTVRILIRLLEKFTLFSTGGGDVSHIIPKILMLD